MNKKKMKIGLILNTSFPSNPSSILASFVLSYPLLFTSHLYFASFSLIFLFFIVFFFSLILAFIWICSIHNSSYWWRHWSLWFLFSITIGIRRRFNKMTMVIAIYLELGTRGGVCVVCLIVVSSAMLAYSCGHCVNLGIWRESYDQFKFVPTFRMCWYIIASRMYGANIRSSMK